MAKKVHNSKKNRQNRKYLLLLNIVVVKLKIIMANTAFIRLAPAKVARRPTVLDSDDDDDIQAALAKSQKKSVEYEKVINNQKAMIEKLTDTHTDKKAKKNISDEMKSSIVTVLKRCVFKKVKFVTNTEQVDEYVGEIIDHLNMPTMNDPDDEIHQNNRLVFRTTYSDECLKSLNNLRSYVQSTMKEKADAWMDKNGGKLPDLKDIKDCAGRRLDLTNRANDPTVLFYFDVMMPKFTGSSKFFAPAVRYFQEVSKAKTDPNCEYVDITVETEAFGLLVLDNCYDKWVEFKRLYDSPERNDRKIIIKQESKHGKSIDETEYFVLDAEANPKLKTKYSITNVGQDKFGGWSEEGLKKYVNYRKVLYNLRKNDKAKEYEAKVLQIMRVANKIKGNNWQEHMASKGQKPKKKDTAKAKTGIAALSAEPDSDDEAVNFEEV